MAFLRKTCCSLPVLCAALLLSPPPAEAQVTRRDEGGDTARFQAIIGQLTREKAALERDRAELQASLDRLSGELERARAEAARTEERLDRAEAVRGRLRENHEATTAALEQARAQMNELVRKFRETVQALRRTEEEKSRLGDELSASRSRFQACAEDNRALFEVANEVLERYEEKGVFRQVAQNEPFTQLTRVRIENLVDEYRYQLEDNRVPEDDSDAGAADDGD